MQWALYDIGHMYAEAKGLKRSIQSLKAQPWEWVDVDSGAVGFTFDRAIPTLLILKLSAAVEDALDMLWTRRFPEIDTRRLRHEDKLRVMQSLHDLPADTISALWKLRNDCAHKVKTMATWEEVDKYFDAVHGFVEKFQKP